MASKLHGTEVEVGVLQSKSDEGADHVQFLISEKKGSESVDEQTTSDALTKSSFEFLSSGKYTNTQFFMDLLGIKTELCPIFIDAN